ncbi:hypothetical protein JAAARDRAFT_168655 [Jaapia argillacea MUCL 33604]|uniref:Diaminopimelate epimerase-like protein n=1 Tax=Jaapia argillacea MUCL 33604 TaxID=933084 RepID=A0A067Q846_9AGAM|nr:hypothetical protein JAAARDRAFT_168655 [Jaapia argillacea MUCL 33604]
MSSVPFYLLNAFTVSLSGGNPAAVVVLSEGLEPELLQQMARNLNQPAAAFIWSSTTDVAQDVDTAAFHIRWFTVEEEIPLCGHGTMAASKVIFDSPTLSAGNVSVIKFQTRTGGTVTAKKVDGGQIEISLPSTTLRALGSEEEKRVRAVITRALGKESVSINYMAAGGEGFGRYLMIEVDEKERLAGCKVDIDILKLTAPYVINVLTSSSSNPETHFVSRMFAPLAGVPEDHVCGSAHCLTGPYWATKKGLGSSEMRAKMVSERGGDLRVVWDEGENLIKLRGDVKATARGEIFVD